MSDDMGGGDLGESTPDVDVSADIDTSVEDTSIDIPEDVPEDIPEDIPEDEPEVVEEDISEDIPEDVPEDEPEVVEEDISEDIPEDVPEDESEVVEEDISEDTPEDIPEDESEVVEEDISEDTPEDIPEDEPEVVEEDISEDLPNGQTDVEDTTTGTEDGNSTDIPKDSPDSGDSNALGGVADDIPEKTALNRMAEYMNAHNYGREDYATYSQDPEWISINRDLKAEDGIQQTAQERMADYMGSHNYGREDYATYSQDPEWIGINRDLKAELGIPQTAQEKLADYMGSHNYGQEDFSTYSQDPEWRALQQEAYPNYELPPLNSPDNLGQWKEIPSDLSYEENLNASNPNYDLGDEWMVNCQRCVPTYEMRSRGYDVTAQPCIDDDDYLSYHPYDVWEGADVQNASGNGFNDIQDAMGSWGDGSRAQVCLQWDAGDGGHTFMAEQRNGKTYFVDPQTGDTDCSWYFDNARPGSVSFCRTDQLMPSSRILDCCKGGRV